MSLSKLYSVKEFSDDISGDRYSISRSQVGLRKNITNVKGKEKLYIHLLPMYILVMV
jgi:hypothetical protein